jgi:hypothetical protein
MHQWMQQWKHHALHGWVLPLVVQLLLVRLLVVQQGVQLIVR